MERSTEGEPVVIFGFLGTKACLSNFAYAMAGAGPAVPRGAVGPTVGNTIFHTPNDLQLVKTPLLCRCTGFLVLVFLIGRSVRPVQLILKTMVSDWTAIGIQQAYREAVVRAGEVTIPARESGRRTRGLLCTKQHNQ